MKEAGAGMLLIALGLLALMLVLALPFWAWPRYNVYASTMSGQAHLREAEFSRLIAVVEAEARLQAETLNAQSEVARARGVAQSNEIIAATIDEMYIRYLWVKTLDGAQKEIIYVPTEANLPITEAGRLLVPKE